jgi:hypothetical protein
VGTGVIGDISHRQDAGLGDLGINLTQSFGGAGTPLRAGLRTSDILLAGGIIVGVIVLFPWLRKLMRGSG